MAAEAIQSGKVKKGGVNLKPAHLVGIGEQYEIRTDVGKILIEVLGLIPSRVQYSQAIQYYVDLTPEKEKGPINPTSFVFNTGKRKNKQGRPTKKEKRNLDRFLE